MRDTKFIHQIEKYNVYHNPNQQQDIKQLNQSGVAYSSTLFL